MRTERARPCGARSFRGPAPAAIGFDNSQDEWFRPKQAAAYLKSSESTLAKKRLKGNGPTYTKFGRLVLYAKQDLDEFLASRRRLSTSDAGTEVALLAPASAPLPVRGESVGFASSKATGYERPPNRPYPKRRSR